MPLMTMFFYLPIEFPIVDDGLRSLDINFQSKIDEMYRDFLKSAVVAYVELSGNEEQRLEKALLYLRRY